MKASTIIRAQHGSANPYFSTARATAQNDSLSYEARGMLWYLLSKPDDWEVRISDLKIPGKAGRDKVYSILRELKEAGHLIREKTRRQDGTWDWGAYQVYERPYTENPEMVTGEPYTENPDTDSPDTENPEIKEQKKDSTEQRTTKEKDIAPVGATVDFSMYDEPIGPEPATKEETEKVTNIAIGELIKVWVSVQEIIEDNPYKVKGYRSAARALYKAGITPDDLTAFIQDRKADSFWKDKTLTWTHIKNNIQGWKTQRNAQPDNPAHREYIPEKKDQCRGGVESAQILFQEIGNLFRPQPLEDAS